jgi:hypothetical protein
MKLFPLEVGHYDLYKEVRKINQRKYGGGGRGNGLKRHEI